MGRFLLLLACAALISTGCTTTNNNNTNNGNCDAAGGSNSLNCSSVPSGASGRAPATAVPSSSAPSSASAPASGSASVLPVQSATAPDPVSAAGAPAGPQTKAPTLYIYTGNGTMAELQVNSTEAAGTSPAQIVVPGGTIEDKYGSRIPLPTGCGYTNDSYPGWWVPYAPSSPSRSAGLSCALFQGKTASTVANVTVAAWTELPAPYTGSYVSLCLTYVTFSPYGNNPVGADETVFLYWNGTAWEDVANGSGVWSAYCG